MMPQHTPVAGTYRRAILIGVLSLYSLSNVSDSRATNIAASSTFNGTASGDDTGLDIVADSNGNTFIAGYATGATQEIWLGKYDTAAVFQSSTTIAGSGGSSDSAEGIALDSNGNVYAAGLVNETVGGDNIWVGKYDSDLILLSSASFNGSGNGSDGAQAVAVDSTGIVYVAGFVENTNDIWIGRFDSNLVYLSSIVFNGSGNGADFLDDIIIGSDGYIYVAGTVNEAAGGDNIYVAKYSKSLVLLASASVNGVGNAADSGTGVVIDTNTNVFVSGFATDANFEIFIGKFDSSLVLQSTAAIGGSGNGSDLGKGITVDNGGDIIIAGTINETVGGLNVWLAKFSPSLILISSTSHDGTAGGSDFGESVAIDSSGNVIVTGQVNDTGADIYLAIHAFEVLTNFSSAAGGTLTYTMPGGTAQIVIPAGALSSDVLVSFSGASSLGDSGLANINLSATNVSIDITLTPAIQPNQFIPITLPYRDSDVSAFDENTLLIARFDTGANTWVPLFSTPDPGGNTVTALTDHFSVFQIMAVVASANVESIRAFPNPFRPSAGHTVITLVNMPPRSRIRIYTTTGEKVRDFTANSAGVATWNARNQSGLHVAPGVYYGYVQGSSDRDKKTFKIAVER